MPPDLNPLYHRLTDDLLLFAPELVISVTIVALLFARLFPLLDRVHLSPLAGIGCAVSLFFVTMQWDTFDIVQKGSPAFTGLVYLDGLAAFLRAYVLLGTMAVLILGRITGLPDRIDSADFCVLLLGAALGMMLMASANHFLMAFLAVEMASLPSYALVGFLKGKSRGSEAALKYAMYGAAASGLMLYGISLLVSVTGSGSFAAYAQSLSLSFQGGTWEPMLVVGTVFVFVGLGFKLSAVPFHVWLPDAFEGAAAEVAAFLSVVSKGAALGLTLRIAMRISNASWITDTTALTEYSVGVGILIAGALTTTVGNILAFGQKSLPRLLAYSTIAHAGIMLMALGLFRQTGSQAILVYLVGYLFANIGVFAIVAFVRNATGRDDVEALRGLMSRSPILALCFAIFILSLLGLPPTAGFAGKFLVFSAAWGTGKNWVVAVGIINTVISAGYYLKLLRLAGLEAPTTEGPLGEPASARIYVVVLAAFTLLVGLALAPLLNLTKIAVGGY